MKMSKKMLKSRDCLNVVGVMFSGSVLPVANATPVRRGHHSNKINESYAPVESANEKKEKLTRATAAQTRAIEAFDQARKDDTTEAWNKAAKLYDEAADACRLSNNWRKAKSARAYADRARAAIAWVQARKDNTTEAWNRAARLYSDAADALMDANNEEEAKYVRANAEWVKARKEQTPEAWNRVSRLYDEAANAFSAGNNEARAKSARANAAEALAVSAWAQANKDETPAAWHLVAKRNEEAANAFSEANDEKEAETARANAAQARANAAWAQAYKYDTPAAWNLAAIMKDKSASACSHANYEGRAKSARAYAAKARAISAWRQACKYDTPVVWDVASKMYTEAAVVFSNIDEVGEAGDAISNADRASTVAARLREKERRHPSDLA